MFEIRPGKNRLKKYFGSGNPAKSWPATLPRSRQGPSQSASPERHGLYFVLIEWTDKVLCVHHCISLYHNPMIRRNSVCNLIPSFAHTLRLPFLPIWAEPFRENYEHHAWPSSEFPSLLFFSSYSSCQLPEQIWLKELRDSATYRFLHERHKAIAFGFQRLWISNDAAISAKKKKWKLRKNHMRTWICAWHMCGKCLWKGERRCVLARAFVRFVGNKSTWRVCRKGLMSFSAGESYVLYYCDLF